MGPTWTSHRSRLVMKVYIVQYSEPKGSDILGVFSTLDLARQMYVHEWSEQELDSWHRRTWTAIAASPTHTSIAITEFEVE